MPPLPALLSYLIFVFLGGALLAPWLFESVQWAASNWPWLNELAKHPFHRYVDRSLLLVALLGVYPFARALRRQHPEDLGLRHPWAHKHRLWAGLALGCGILTLLALTELGVGARRLDLEHSFGVFLQKLAGAVVTAVVVSLIEELLFRGVIFGSLRRTHRLTTAIIVSSGVYALVHFFQKPPAPAHIGWLSGLTTVGQMLAGFSNWQTLVPDFVSLFLVGLLLAMAYEHTGNLWMSIGLHASWIFCIRFYGLITERQPGAGTRFWGTHRMIDGWVTLILLVGLAILVWLVRSRRPAEQSA